VTWKISNWKLTAILAVAALLVTCSATTLVIALSNKGETTPPIELFVIDTSTPDPTETPEPTPSPSPEPTETPEPMVTPNAGAKHTIMPPPVIDGKGNYLAPYRAQNTDVTGFIHIPGTYVSYPIVKGNDNAYYLTHTWQKKSSRAGAIFMDVTNDRGFGSQNTTLYGHHSYGSEMFNSLDMLQNRSYVKQFNKMYITLNDRQLTCDIFAVSIVQENYDYRRSSYGDKAGFDAYIQRLLDRDMAKLGIRPQYGSRIVVLSTCNYSVWKTGRLVVAAVIRD